MVFTSLKWITLYVLGVTGASSSTPSEAALSVSKTFIHLQDENEGRTSQRNLIALPSDNDTIHQKKNESNGTITTKENEIDGTISRNEDKDNDITTEKNETKSAIISINETAGNDTIYRKENANDGTVSGKENEAISKVQSKDNDTIPITENEDNDTISITENEDNGTISIAENEDNDTISITENEDNDTISITENEDNGTISIAENEDNYTISITENEDNGTIPRYQNWRNNGSMSRNEKYDGTRQDSYYGTLSKKESMDDDNGTISKKENNDRTKEEKGNYKEMEKSSSCECLLQTCECSSPTGIITSTNYMVGTLVYKFALKEGEVLLMHVVEANFSASEDCSVAIGDTILNGSSNFSDVWLTSRKSITIEEYNTSGCHWKIAYRTAEATSTVQSPKENQETKTTFIVNLSGISLVKEKARNVSVKFQESLSVMISRFLTHDHIDLQNIQNVSLNDVVVYEMKDCDILLCGKICTSFNFSIEIQNPNGDLLFTPDLIKKMLLDKNIQDSWMFDECQVCDQQDGATLGWLGLGGVIVFLIVIIFISLVYKVNETIYFNGSRSRSNSDLSYLTTSSVPVSSRYSLPTSKRKGEKEVKDPPGWNYNISGFEQFDPIGQTVDLRAYGLEEEMSSSRRTVTFYSNSLLDEDEHELFSQTIARNTSNSNHVPTLEAAAVASNYQKIPSLTVRNQGQNIIIVEEEQGDNTL